MTPVTCRCYLPSLKLTARTRTQTWMVGIWKIRFPSGFLPIFRGERAFAVSFRGGTVVTFLKPWPLQLSNKISILTQTWIFSVLQSTLYLIEMQAWRKTRTWVHSCLWCFFWSALQISKFHLSIESEESDFISIMIAAPRIPLKSYVTPFHPGKDWWLLTPIGLGGFIIAPY